MSPFELLKKFGEMKIQGVLWVWDFANNKPRIKSEMSKDELAKSERIKWTGIKEQFDAIKQ